MRRIPKKNKTSSCGIIKKKEKIKIKVPSSHERRRKKGEKEKLKVGQIKLYIYGIVTSVE